MLHFISYLLLLPAVLIVFAALLLRLLW
jgi:hypothetical protein